MNTQPDNSDVVFENWFVALMDSFDAAQLQVAFDVIRRYFNHGSSNLTNNLSGTRPYDVYPSDQHLLDGAHAGSTMPAPGTGTPSASCTVPCTVPPNNQIPPLAQQQQQRFRCQYCQKSWTGTKPGWITLHLLAKHKVSWEGPSVLGSPHVAVVLGGTEHR